MFATDARRGWHDPRLTRPASPRLASEKGDNCNQRQKQSHEWTYEHVRALTRL